MMKNEGLFLRKIFTLLPAAGWLDDNDKIKI
jgi:hypothetical protein